jgi:hypothetical protein
MILKRYLHSFKKKINKSKNRVEKVFKLKQSKDFLLGSKYKSRRIR